MEESGGSVAQEDDVVEVSPLVSYAGEGLGPLVDGKTFDAAYVSELQGFSAGAATSAGGTGGGVASNAGLWVVPAVLGYAAVAAVGLVGKGRK